jgi:flagellar FliJ protein
MLRLKRFDLAEKARKVANLETMIREFETMTSDLDRQIAAEEGRTGVKDRSHFAYSTFAKSALQRRENLAVSIRDLQARLEGAARERDEAALEVEAAEAAESFEASRARHERPLSALAR